MGQEVRLKDQKSRGPVRGLGLGPQVKSQNRKEGDRQIEEEIL